MSVQNKLQNDNRHCAVFSCQFSMSHFTCIKQRYKFFRNNKYYLEFLSGSVEIELISFLVVLAALTKSAQIPFFLDCLQLWI
jgi:NADH:ubiquinone oxidoreductase subunit 5 (subunit L)/multisubunit Na+/H+ antiporter MnhA subunit